MTSERKECETSKGESEGLKWIYSQKAVSAPPFQKDVTSLYPPPPRLHLSPNFETGSQSDAYLLRHFTCSNPQAAGKLVKHIKIRQTLVRYSVGSGVCGVNGLTVCRSLHSKHYVALWSLARWLSDWGPAFTSWPLAVCLGAIISWGRLRFASKQQ